MLAHVKAFFEANESSRFESITPDPDHAERIYNRVGYWKIENGEKVFYVLPEQFKKEICKGYDSRKVARALLTHNLLEHDTGKSVKTVRLPCRNLAVKVYAIRESIFSQEIDIFEGNKGNKGNSLDSKGFERVTQAKIEKVTRVTSGVTGQAIQPCYLCYLTKIKKVTRKTLAISIMLPVLPMLPKKNSLSVIHSVAMHLNQHYRENPHHQKNR